MSIETRYPVRPDESIQWDKPLYDSDGFEHSLVALGSVEVVTKQAFTYAVWSRVTGACRIEGAGDLVIGNTPMSDQERARRRESMLAELRQAPSSSSAAVVPVQCVNALVDIARIIGENGLRGTGDSRSDADLFLEWAKAFQADFDQRRDAGESPGDTYFEDIEDFALAKAEEHGFLRPATRTMDVSR